MSSHTGPPLLSYQTISILITAQEINYYSITCLLYLDQEQEQGQDVGGIGPTSRQL